MPLPGAAKTFTTALRARKCIPPLVAGATTFPPQAVGLCVLSNVDMSLQESIETYSAPACGGSPAQPDRGRRAQRASQQNCFHVI